MKDQLTEPSLYTIHFHTNFKNPSDKAAHLLIIKRQMPKKASNLFKLYESIRPASLLKP